MSQVTTLFETALELELDAAANVFDELAIRTHDGLGITRASYGEGEHLAHQIIADAGAAGGLEVSTDAACNTYVTLPGSDRGAAPIIIGSHLDSVAQGGNFDGAAGVVSGLAVIKACRRAAIKLQRDVRVMGIRAEESAWFGVSYIGSRSALGTLPADALARARRSDDHGLLADYMRRAGGNPAGLQAGDIALPPDTLHAYVEVHIEQGPVLDSAGLPLAIVSGIRANRRFPSARCSGEYSHCGGVPRSHRRDAVIATSELVGVLDAHWDEAEQMGRDFAFTVGKFSTDADWHAMTKIAGEVSFSIDMRSLDLGFLDETERLVRQAAADIEKRRGVRFDLGEMTRAAPGLLSMQLRRELTNSAATLDIAHMELASGASHDAAAFADAGVDTAMLFIRNANGSHNPDEAMALADFNDATRVLGHWLLSHHAATQRNV
jgi:beta-ureidopropionase / N-carbamoyl-L-amino-acid hydrolase